MKNTITSSTFLTLLIILSPLAAKAQTLTRGPYLQLQTPDSMSVVWVTDTACMGAVEWGPTSAYGHIVDSDAITTRHEFAIMNLAPDTPYHYRVRHAATHLSEDATFRTAPAPGSKTLSFTVQGDSRSNPPDCKAVFDAMLPETKMGFCISLGDLPGRGEDNKTDYWQRHFFNPARDFVNNVCLYPCIGNHELYNENSYPDFVFPAKYLDVWTLPTSSSGNEFYYSFDKGDAHFACVDVYWSDYAVDSDQYNWLVKDLAGTKKRWKFVFAHSGPYVSQRGKSEGTIKIRENLAPVFESQDVDLVMFGHYHDYQRNIVNGVNYLLQGTGGADTSKRVDDSQSYVQAFASEFSFTRIDLDEKTLLGRTMAVDKTVIDGFQIDKTPAPLPWRDSFPAGSPQLNWIAPRNFETQCGIVANPGNPSGDGYAYQVSDTAGHQFAYPMTANESMTNISIEADVYFDSTPAVKNRFGIGLRGRLFFAPDQRSYYTLAFVNNDALGEDGHCLLIMVEGATESVLADYSSPDSSGWHKLKLSADGNKLSVWIDGKLKTAPPISDGALSRGRPFIYNYRADETGAKTLADDVVISSLGP